MRWYLRAVSTGEKRGALVSATGALVSASGVLVSASGVLVSATGALVSVTCSRGSVVGSLRPAGGSKLPGAAPFTHDRSARGAARGLFRDISGPPNKPSEKSGSISLLYLRKKTGKKSIACL